MVQIYRSFSGLMPFVAPLVLVGCLGAGLLYRSRRRRWSDQRRAALHTLLDLILLGNATALVALTLTRGYGEPRSLNLVPFYEVYQVVTQSSGATAPVVEVIGNAVLLVPLAAVLGCRCGWSKPVLRTTLVAFAISTGIELIQYVFGLGRVASVTDVLLPTIGAAVTSFIADLAASAYRFMKFDSRSLSTGSDVAAR